MVNPVINGPFARKRLSITFKKPSLAKQAFKDECDINNIMARFVKDGILQHYNQFQGQYGDFTDCPEYHDAQNRVIAANAMFLTLPAKIRTQFQNDPGKFLDFVGDKANLPAMIEMGLAKPQPPTAAAPPPPTTPPPA